MITSKTMHMWCPVAPEEIGSRWEQFHDCHFPETTRKWCLMSWIISYKKLPHKELILGMFLYWGIHSSVWDLVRSSMSYDFDTSFACAKWRRPLGGSSWKLIELTSVSRFLAYVSVTRRHPSHGTYNKLPCMHCPCLQCKDPGSLLVVQLHVAQATKNMAQQTPTHVPKAHELSSCEITANMWVCPPGLFKGHCPLGTWIILFVHKQLREYKSLHAHNSCAWQHNLIHSQNGE